MHKKCMVNTYQLRLKLILNINEWLLVLHCTYVLKYWTFYQWFITFTEAERWQQLRNDWLQLWCLHVRYLYTSLIQLQIVFYCPPCVRVIKNGFTTFSPTEIRRIYCYTQRIHTPFFKHTHIGTYKGRYRSMYHC